MIEQDSKTPAAPVEAPAQTPIATPVLSFLAALVAVGILVIILQGISSILIPFLQAAFVALVASKPVTFLERHSVPRVLSAIVVVLCIVSLVAAVIVMVGAGLTNVAQGLLAYEARFQELKVFLVDLFLRIGVELPPQILGSFLQPQDIMGFVARVAGSLGGSIIQTFFVVIIATYALLDAPAIQRRLQKLARPGARLDVTMERFTTMIYRYLLIRTIASIGTGVTAGVLLGVIGVPYPILWGLVAMILNYIPQVGSVIAAIIPAVLALITFGILKALLTLGVFLLANLVFGNVIEPRLLGLRFGLPVVLILFSLVFWGWIFGATGVFLSVPLTMGVIFVLERSPTTRRIAYFLAGDEGLPNPDEA